ncbi:hypothetical protein RAS2_09190 [Phycisphaerae bacterium RAS2]|nr:hypothetical protein RAS2_09190 [Phycisphaerae bacterium RAS2]
MIQCNDRLEKDSTAHIQHMLDRWYIAASGTGSLWLQPRGPNLSLREFCLVFKRIAKIFEYHRFDAVIFYFDGIEAPRSLWLIVMRLLTALAQRLQTNCRVIRTDRPKSTRAALGELTGLAAQLLKPNIKAATMKLDGVSVVIEPNTDWIVRPDGRA